MTSEDILYRVTADNGLSGLAVGCEAANVLCDEMGQRPDVVSVEATPLRCHWDDCPHGSECLHVRTLAETLEFLGHGEQL